MAGYIGSKAVNLSTTGADINGDANINGDLSFRDNDKIKLGAGSDLSIFHNGSASIIEDSGTGGITLRSNLFTVQNAAGTETVAQFVEDGFVKLFHNNSQVFTTISSGASITGSLGIGTSTPRTGLHLYGAGQTTSAISDAGSLGAFLRVSDTGTVGGSGGGVVFGSNQSEADGFAGFAAIKGLLSNGNDRTIGALAFSTRAANADTALTERMRLTSDGKLGIGTSSPARTLEVYSSAPAIKLNNGTNAFTIGTGAFVDGSNSLVFFDEGVGERMRLDASGNLLVGGITTLPSSSVNGFGVLPTGIVVAAVSNDKVTVFKRNGSDGDISLFQKNSTTVGSIGTLGGHTYIGGPSASGLYFGGSRVQPMSSGSLADNSIDMGHPSYRFDDIYATNGTIQTSDRNEKQDIAELSNAEQRVAVACKGLLRKFRWKDAVAEKGDEARTHFGIIAQDLQAAFAAEGLDAGDYAMFISSTWTDEETGEERTRMGVRYSELLAFIIGAL